MSIETKPSGIEQLDIFSIDSNIYVKPEQEIRRHEAEHSGEKVFFEKKETEALTKLSDTKMINSTHFRPIATVQEKDKVKVTKPIDSTPDSEGYFSYHRDKKATVVSVKENSRATNEKYQYYAEVIFSNGEHGIFYDLELEVIG